MSGSAFSGRVGGGGDGGGSGRRGRGPSNTGNIPSLLSPGPLSLGFENTTGEIISGVPERTVMTPPPRNPSLSPSPPPSSSSSVVFVYAPPAAPSNPPSDPKKSPARSPFASKGARDSQNRGIFSNTNVPGSEMERIIQNDTSLPDTPSKTNDDAIARLQQQVRHAVDDAKLLEDLRRREQAVRGNKTQQERKQELRKSTLPWIYSGLKHIGPRRPGLFLEDGTRNPERPRKGSGNRPPTGEPPQPPPPPPSPPAENRPPSNPENKNSQNTTSSLVAETAKTTVTTQTDSSRANKPKATKTSSSSTSRDGGTRPTTAGGRPPTILRPPTRGGKNTPSSPLRNSVTAGDVNVPDPASGTDSVSDADPLAQGIPPQTGLGTGGAPWQARSDLFQAGVMDAAGITAALPSEQVAPLPTLPSSIDYDVENWET